MVLGGGGGSNERSTPVWEIGCHQKVSERDILCDREARLGTDGPASGFARAREERCDVTVLLLGGFGVRVLPTLPL